MDNACFASVVAALYLTKSHMDKKSSYYPIVLNFADIEFSIIFKDIPKSENLNISINMYSIEDKQILSLRLIGNKKDKHVNLLYLQEPRNDNIAWMKDLSLIRSQITGKKNRKYFWDR